ncbi:hypothetical protein C5167_002041 [Papaver somniferum]|uniref:U-box domain-containing protein n=1 Tax=Papaver somniferum TaxID=3469 RepID=A0A4Y7L0J8_PAPSO|nr:E3 ubiquitin-protein ligase PUB23-like [Papaver somniferum]RZC77861.1 hypothetical protein C5167_002041 [Papaver somniferum]
MEKKPDPEMEIPLYFRCPISMEVMKNPVTISTGLSYEKKNIENWFNVYKKKTCPATMQILQNFDVTPNYTLERLILVWQERESKAIDNHPSSSISIKHDELVSLLTTIESTPFKVSSLKKLRSCIELGLEVRLDFVHLGGIEVLSRIITQVLIDRSDFITFRACEEALGVVYQLPISDDASMDLLSKPECMKAMATMLQHGSAEARYHTVTIFRNMSKVEYNWNLVVQDQGMDLFKSLLELVSDEIYTKASSCALDVLIDILSSSKQTRLKAIEAGAICVLIELLPDSNKSICERMLLIIKLLCECAEGRLAFVDHKLGIAALSKKILRVSICATKLGVKILWLLSSFHPKEKVIEDMLVFGSVKKILGLLHIEGQSSTKDNAVKIIKMHGNSWKKYPCFPSELKDYLRLAQDSN